MPAGDGDEGDGLGVVTDLLDEVGGLLDDLVESVLGPLAGVHLVASNDELPDTKGEGEESVLSGLAILGDSSLKTASGGINNEDSTISLGGSSNHVLDKVTMSRGINDSAVVLGGLKLPQSNVNGDTTLTLSLELVENPG